MINRSSFIPATLVLAGLFAAPVATADDLEAAATDACKCLEEPYAKFDEIMKIFNEARTSGDFSKIQSMESEMLAISSEAEKCFESMKKKYPKKLMIIPKYVVGRRHLLKRIHKLMP